LADFLPLFLVRWVWPVWNRVPFVQYTNERFDSFELEKNGCLF
jgi:hypothetical protein